MELRSTVGRTPNHVTGWSGCILPTRVIPVAAHNFPAAWAVINFAFFARNKLGLAG